MKLLRQSILYQQQGASDRVFEIDLCEVGPEKFVVNFRHGRRGGALAGGSKTVAPVSHEKADSIFTRLVEEKLNGGYQIAPDSGAPVKPPKPEEIVTAEIVETPAAPQAGKPLDSRRAAVLRRISQGNQSDSNWSLSRAVWRAGELNLTEAAPLLGKLAGSGDKFLDYSIAWTLGRTGRESDLAILRELQANNNQPFMVRRMAAEAILKLLPADRRPKAVEGYIGQLPETMQPLVQTGSHDALHAALKEHLNDQDPKTFGVLEAFYFIDNDLTRPVLLRVLREAPLKPSYFQRLRRIFKAAEFRGDAEVFGILARRFAKERPNFRMGSFYWYRYRNKRLPTEGPNPEYAFGEETANYLRRRTWNTLRRLGETGSAEYVRLAVGVLLPFTDADAEPIRTNTTYDWTNYHRTRRLDTITTYWDEFGRYWAFNKILYDRSQRYRPNSQQTSFLCVAPYKPGDPDPAFREEAFPELWEQQPRGLLHLLDASRCHPVHKFAAKALRACTDFCQSLEIDALQMLLSAPYVETAQLGFELAQDRYDPALPNRKLVLAVAHCAYEPARRKGCQWIDANRQFFFDDTEFAAALLSGPFADTRGHARAALRIVSPSGEKAKALVGRLVSLLLHLEPEQAEIATDVTSALLESLSEQLAGVDEKVIRDLLGRELPVIQQFAGELVLRNPALAKHPPADLLSALLNAADPSTRAIGVRIIEGLEESFLKSDPSLLATLLTHAREDVRSQVRPLAKRLSQQDSAFGRGLAAELIQRILTPGAPEGVPTFTSKVLREDLAEFLGETSAETVWKLLQSRSQPAQEVGGALLEKVVRPEQLSTEELVRLAGHNIVTVRQSAWNMLSADLPRLKQEMDVAVSLLDSKWEDTRQFAFRLFRENFSEADFNPGALVALCDSVRPDVQQFGQEMITRHFQQPHGQEYLQKLSEHPAANLQLFASNYLDDYAAGQPQRLAELEPYFITVLSQVNRGRVAKTRVLKLLEEEALKNEESARVAARIFSRQSATCAIGDKEAMILAMTRIRTAWPNLSLPIEIVPWEVRSGV